MADHFFRKAARSALIICSIFLPLLLTSSPASATELPLLTKGKGYPKNVHIHPYSVVRYQGKGYNLLYDSAWQATPDGDDGVSVSYAGTRLDVLVQHTITPVAILHFELGTLSTMQCQQAAQVPHSAVIAGKTWTLARYICGDPPLQKDGAEEIITLDTKDAVGGAYYSMAVVARPGTLDKHAFKSIASFRFE